MIFALIFSSFAAIADVTIAPYLFLDHDNQRSIGFQSPVTVELKVNGQSLSMRPTAEFQKLRLGPLNCGDELSYAVVEDGHETIKESVTAVPCSRSETFYFGFLSDTQIKNSWAQKQAERLALTVTALKKKFPIPLIINAGDIVQHGGREEEWQNFFETTKSYSADSYLIAAVGNHEYYESPSLDRAPPLFQKYLRHGHPDDLGYLKTELGPLNLIVLNSNFESMTEAKIKEQWVWLEAELEHAQRTKRPTLITLHHSPFSSNLEHLREIPRRLREEFVPMIERFSQVKMVLSGHLHMYERSQKLGITYLTAGPSGGIFNVFSYKNPYSVLTKQMKTTFTVFKVSPVNLEVTTYDSSSTVLDRFTVSL